MRRVLPLLLLIGLSFLSGCGGFITAHVPLIRAGSGEVSLTSGRYEVTNRQTNQNEWTVVQTGIEIHQSQDHYLISLDDDAMTIIGAGSGISGMVLDGTAFGNEAALSPQQQFLKDRTGFVTARLDEGFFALQAPLTYNPQDLPSKQANSDKTIAEWTLGLLHSIDDQTWEVSLCNKCDQVAATLYGSKQECLPSGSCSTVPNVRDYGSDSEQNLEILRKSAQAFGLNSVIRVKKMPKN